MFSRVSLCYKKTGDCPQASHSLLFFWYRCRLMVAIIGCTCRSLLLLFVILFECTIQLLLKAIGYFLRYTIRYFFYLFPGKERSLHLGIKKGTVYCIIQIAYFLK